MRFLSSILLAGCVCSCSFGLQSGRGPPKWHLPLVHLRLSPVVIVTRTCLLTGLGLLGLLDACTPGEFAACAVQLLLRQDVAPDSPLVTSYRQVVIEEFPPGRKAGGGLRPLLV
jgi:hypothetical protein